MTVNHGVLGSSPCSGAFARGLHWATAKQRCDGESVVDSIFRRGRGGAARSPKPFFETGV